MLYSINSLVRSSSDRRFYFRFTLFWITSCIIKKKVCYLRVNTALILIVLTALDRQRKTNCRRARKEDTGLDITVLAFYFSCSMWLLGVSSSHHCGGCATSLQNSPNNMGAVIFGSSSYHRVSCPTNILFLFSNLRPF